MKQIMKFKKSLKMAGIFIVLGGLTSCSDKEKEVKEFSERFSNFVMEQQMDSVKALYPTMAFDSIGFAAPIGEIRIDEITVGKPIKVDLGNGSWLIVEMDNDGFKIRDSHGVAAFPKEQAEMATATGMYTDEITDNVLFERLKDAAFLEWLKDKTYEAIGGNIEMGIGDKRRNFSRICEGWEIYLPVTVTNRGVNKVDGKAYKISYTQQYARSSDGSVPDAFRTLKVSGKDLEPGESKQIIIHEDGIVDVLNPQLEYTVSKDDYFKDNFNPTGSEYQEYLNSKK